MQRLLPPREFVREISYCFVSMEGRSGSNRLCVWFLSWIFNKTVSSNYFNGYAPQELYNHVVLFDQKL